MLFTKKFLVLTVISLAFLSACTEPDTYPVTGEKASEGDWVRHNTCCQYYGGR